MKVIDKTDDVVRLATDTPAKVYVWDTNKNAWVGPYKIVLPAGWWAGPGP